MIRGLNFNVNQQIALVLITAKDTVPFFFFFLDIQIYKHLAMVFKMLTHAYLFICKTTPPHIGLKLTALIFYFLITSTIQY